MTEREVAIDFSGDFTNRIESVLEEVALRLDPNGEITFTHDPDSPVKVSNDRFRGLSKPADILYAEIRSTEEHKLSPFPDVPNEKVLYLDIETHNEGRQWDMSPREFFRLGQYAWGIDGEVVLTESYDVIMEQLAKAGGVVVHNGHNFDLSVLYGKDSTTPMLMAQEKKVIDTMVWANLAFPAPPSYVARGGSKFFPKKPGEFLRWLSLDNLAYQFQIPGKYGSLKDIAKKYNPPKTKVADLDFGLIDLNDEDFLAYAKQDIVALQGITHRLCLIGPMNEYYWREQLCAAINAQITRNGFHVSIDAVTARRDELENRRQEIMDGLVRDYDFPTEGKSPWASNAGKEAIVRILADFGITPETHEWPRTPTGALKLGGEDLKKLTEGTDAEEIGNAIAEVKGQRSLSQLTLDCLKGDSRVHPSIDDLQRSGRSSVTNPGLTVWTSRGDNAVEKAYYTAPEGYKLVSFDYSNADARAVAAYSKDEDYRKNFLPGVDNHMNVARQVYGEREDFDERAKDYRQLAKALSHAWNYGGGAKTISRASGQDLETADHFVKKMNGAFPGVVAWRNRMATMGERDGFIVNKWGRKMPVERDQAYTQSGALMGQSGTREVMNDAKIKMLEHDPRLVQWIAVPIHDELLFCIPESELAWAVPKIEELMYTNWDGVEFHASHGDPADNWYEAGH